MAGAYKFNLSQYCRYASLLTWQSFQRAHTARLFVWVFPKLILHPQMQFSVGWMCAQVTSDKQADK